jgi:type II secretory pathway pseudopilin PulG
MRQLILLLLLSLTITSCKDVGFRKLEDASDKATLQSAQEALRATELALENYREKNGSYPKTTEVFLYDTLQNYFVIPIDPAHLYRNEKEQTNYIAIGSRRNKIIYRCPATIGAGPYTLYWIGINGTDEEGQGDDVFMQAKSAKTGEIIRRTVRPFKGKNSTIEFMLKVSGLDPDNDHIVFNVKDGDVTIYKDEWKLRSWVDGRLDLTDADKQRIFTDEIERFFKGSHFISFDSLATRPELRSLIVASYPALPRELAKKEIEVFTYDNGKTSVVILWDSKRKRIVNVEMGK